MQILSQSIYVKSVYPSTVCFTEDFKRYFYLQRKAGKSVRNIFLECGIDPDILGEKRISGICAMVNKMAKRANGFADARANNYRRPAKTGAETMEARIKQLEHELAYTRQEVEFLKKLRMADMEAQREWESKHQQQ
jgi:hypothetical protein